MKTTDTMKKCITLALVLGFALIGYGQPHITKVTYQNSAPLFGLFEISFSLDKYANPYDPDVINAYAKFVGPDNQTYTVNAFYYEAYRLEPYNGYEKAYPDIKSNCWKIRFTPNQVGNWQFVIYAVDKSGEVVLSSYDSAPFNFQCLNVDSASGFITKANSHYLKREIVVDGQRQNHSFFPIGPNVAWYNCKAYFDFNTPMGIFDYKRHIDSLSGKANYMRVWLCRYQYLSLYGPEYTEKTNGKETLYFDNTLNQKDAAEFDHILEYAAQNGITIMPCLLTYGDFALQNDIVLNPSDWRNNPFNTKLGLKQQSEFFTNVKAKKIVKNLIRYAVARWGYATNIVSWELWNEVANMDCDFSEFQNQQNLIRWHKEMADYVRANDPFGHLVTTSVGGGKEIEYIDMNIFNSLDIVQYHSYLNIQKAKSKEQTTHWLYGKTLYYNDLYPEKPVFVGEFGFGDLTSAAFKKKDPFGIDLHNSIWASMFSGSMGPASYWFWEILKASNLYDIYKPLLTFCEHLPIPSETFTAQTTGTTKKQSVVFPNNLATYYMVNASEDTLYGWVQDTAFAYQSLRRLTDCVGSDHHFVENDIFDPIGYIYSLNPDKRPKPSSCRNTVDLPITKQAVGTIYVVKWYDSETGLELVSERTTAKVRKRLFSNKKYLPIVFPSSLRDLGELTVNNTYGDAVFSICVEH